MNRIDNWCTIVYLSCLLASIGTCIFYIVKYYHMIDDHHLWQWCIIYGFILASTCINWVIKLVVPLERISDDNSMSNMITYYVKKYICNTNNPLDFILLCCKSIMFIWGCIIYYTIGNTNLQNVHIFTWFQIMFWLLAIRLILIFYTLCFYYKCCLCPNRSNESQLPLILSSQITQISITEPEPITGHKPTTIYEDHIYDL